MPSSRAAAAIAIFLVAVGVYVLTAPRVLRAYEPETAAVTEGFVRTGEFKIIEDSPMNVAGGIAGEDGKLVGRVGLPQPLAEAPFYLVGWALDKISGGGGDGYRYRNKVLLLFNGFVMALVAALVFLIMERLQGSRRWSVTIALLFALASLAWPYSKIGAESMVTLGFALALLGALAARDGDRLWPWALAGFGAGIAVAAKQYSLPAVCALGLIVWPAFKARPELRIPRLAALAAPFVAWMAAMAYYNWSRLGAPFETGNTGYETTLAAPLNAMGLFFSPGKGLIWYSPLVVIGVLGLAVLWRVRDRRLAITLALVVLLGTAVAALVPHWTDETWGPRYLMPVAWLLLLPIPFWVTTRRRQRVLIGVAVVAVAVQLVAILVPFTQTVKSTEALTGFPLYQQRGAGQERDVPFGRDSVRWIPQLSPMLVQGTLVASRVAVAVGAPPITMRYAPYEGAAHELVLSKQFATEVGFDRPDFWWIQPDAGLGGVLAALAAALAAAAGGRVLWRSLGAPALTSG